MVLWRQPTRFRSKCRYYETAKHFRNVITKKPLTSHSMTKILQSLRSSGSLRVLWTGAKTNPLSNTFNSVSVRNLYTEIKNSLRTKNPGNSSFIRQNPPLIESSPVIKVIVVEDSPSSVLLISSLFSLIWEILISVSHKLAGYPQDLHI